MLQELNADFGSQYQVRVYILLYEGGSYSTAALQEGYWVGGNKNEYAIAIGLNQDGSVSWARPFSWTPSEILKLETQQFVEDTEGALDLTTLVEYLRREIPQKWERREFEEFNYLRAEVPLWAAFVSWFIILLFTLVLAYFSINNEWAEGVKNSRPRKRPTYSSWRFR